MHSLLGQSGLMPRPFPAGAGAGEAAGSEAGTGEALA